MILKSFSRKQIEQLQTAYKDLLPGKVHYSSSLLSSSDLGLWRWGRLTGLWCCIETSILFPRVRARCSSAAVAMRITNASTELSRTRRCAEGVDSENVNDGLWRWGRLTGLWCCIETSILFPRGARALLVCGCRYVHYQRFN